MSYNMQKGDSEQRQNQYPQNKGRLNQLYRNQPEQGYQSSQQNNQSSSQVNNYSQQGNYSSQNKLMAQLYTKGYIDNVDQNRRQSKMEINKKDISKIIQANQSSPQQQNNDFTFKTPPDQFTKKKISLINKQSSVSTLRSNEYQNGSQNGSPILNIPQSNSSMKQDGKKNSQGIVVMQMMSNLEKKSKSNSLQPGSFSLIQNLNKENNTDSFNPNNIHLPKLDNYPTSPPQQSKSALNKDDYLNVKQKKSYTPMGDYDGYKMPSSKNAKISQQLSSNSASISDYDTSSGSPNQKSSSKSTISPSFMPQKNYYSSKESNDGNDNNNNNNSNINNMDGGNQSNNTNQQNMKGLTQKNMIGASPRYNIVKYKTNQQRLSAASAQSQQDNNNNNNKAVYPHQLIRPLNPSPDKSESSINSSQMSPDLAQIKKFEKKLKQIKEVDGQIRDKKTSDFNNNNNNNNNNDSARDKQSNHSTYQQPNTSILPTKNIINQNTQKNKYPIMTSVMKSKAGQYSQFIRKQNQDAGLLQLNFLGDKHCSLSGVYDGHGEYGSQVSNFVKKQLVKHLTKEIKQYGSLDDENIDIPSCLKRAYQSTNKELLSQNMFDVQMSGCTAVTVFQYKNELYCANTGDSRAIVVKFTPSYEWKPIELSKDHKPEVPEERARIVACGGRVEQSSNEDGEKSGIYRVWKKNQDLPGLAMSRSMGDTMGRECGVIADPDVIQHTLSEEDKFIIIASDGVWEFLSNQDVARIIAPFYKEGKLNESVEKLIQLSHKEWLKEGDSVDDITAVAYFISAYKDIKD